MSVESDQRDDEPAGETEAWLDEVGSRAGAAIRKPAPASGLDALRRRQRTRQATRAAGGAAGAVLLIVGAILWVNRNDPSDVPVVGTDPPTVEVPVTSTEPDDVANSSTTEVAPTTTRPAAIVDGVRSLSPLGSFELTLDDPNQTEFVFTPDGARLIARTGAAWAVLDSVSGEEMTRLPTDYTDTAGVTSYSVAISPDGTRFTDGRTLWDLGTGDVVAGGLSELITFASFSPDGTKVVGVAARCEDGCVTVFDSRDGAPLYEVSAYPGALPAFSPDSSELVLSAPDGGTGAWPIHVHDAVTGALTRTIPAQLYGNVKFAAGGTRLVVNGPITQFLDYRTGEPAPLDANGGYGRAVVSEDGTRVILDSNPPTDPTRPYFPGYSKSVLDPSDGEVLADLEPHFTDVESFPSATQFSPDGQLVVGSLTELPTNGDSTFPLERLGIGVWDATNGELVATLAEFPLTLGDSVNPAAVSSVRFSPDGSRIVTRSFGGTFTIWPAP